MSDHDNHDCPLCMEAFEIDDLHFYPCTCGYQICRFCWHRIRTDGNGLCPACRKTYTEDPAMYRALSHDEIQKVKKERKQKEAQHKQKISDNRQHLSNIRVIQRHLVFVVGLSNKMADAEVLKRPEYFGSYGKIVKIVINPNTNYAGPQGPSASAYITYTKEDDALKAIISVNEMQPPLKIRASLGTTKYCTHYLRNMACPKVDCMYLHDVGEPEASFTKEDMQAGKHQLFEKNLLENYMKNHQQEQLQSQDSYEDYDGSDQLDTNSQEDWGEESDTSNDKSLPSKSSWGTSKEDRNINMYMNNEPSPSDYPVLEAHKPSPKQITEAPVVPTEEPPEISRPAPAPISTPKSVPKPVPVQPVLKPVVKPTSQKDGVLNPGFSTGWATSFEAPIVEPNAIPDNINNNNNFLWPTTSDLGLSDLKIDPNEDDLGFDPFNESKSGLEDLIANEKQTEPTPPSAPRPSFSWDAFWPSNYGSSQNQLPVMNSYSLFGASQPMSNSHLAQYRPPPPSMNQYPISPMGAGNNPLNMVRFSNPHQSQPQRFPIQLPNSTPGQKQPQAPQQHFMNQYQFPQSSNPGSTPHLPTSTPAPVPSGGISTDNKNWQDGLRALLPNINISFSNQQLEKKLSEKWTSNETTQKPTPAQTSDLDKGSVSSPPPGFKVFSSINGDVKQPWISTAEKSGPRPPPPPGFGKASEPFPTHPQPGLLNVQTGVLNTPVPSNFNINSLAVTSASQGSHEDPSILWSKVLKDVPKEIENTDIAFPLPGENLKLGSSLDSSRGIPSMVPPTPNQLTSWNTIVSGNQSGKGQLKTDIDSSIIKGQSTLQILSKEPSEPILQKSPIFGNQQNLSMKQKPTATVKPLKCNPTLDGFTTVQSSRQINSQPTAITASTASTGSRVSELDDFSADLPVDMSNTLNSLSDYPMVGASLLTKNTTKKKKRKGKDQIEQITEITVGQVESERPPVPIIDDLDRPKKNGKAKKKAGMKVSPPAQRKSPPPVPKAKEQTQPIRILKSDGNCATTTFSPAQVAADNGEVSKTVNSSNHDHEIVSRLTESTEKLLKNVLFETEAIKLNTEQISKDLKSALEKCKESSLSLSDLEKINLLLTPGKLPLGDLDDPDMVDTYDLERQVESARREAKMLEARLNDVIRKNMASELETLKRNTKNSPQ